MRIWLQSNIAKWRWLPSIITTPGGVFPVGIVPNGGYYRPSFRTLHWGRWVWSWQVVVFPVDALPDGAETVVNGHKCVVKCWRGW